MSNLTGLFDNVNENVASISGQIGQTPQGWNGDIFSMIQTLSETVILPIAGVILAIVMTLELIQIVTDRNNFHEIETAVFFKWMFKSACAILIVTNTWTIVMGVFDAAQSVVAQAAGVVVADATVDVSSITEGLEERLMEMDFGPLVRAVVPVVVRRHHRMGGGHLHLHRHLRAGCWKFTSRPRSRPSPWRR